MGASTDTIRNELIIIIIIIIIIELHYESSLEGMHTTKHLINHH
jgi:hypothetical protein